MKDYLTQAEYKEIKELTGYALAAANKKQAENYIRRLQSCGYGLTGRAKNLTDSIKELLDNGVIEKTLAADVIASLEFICIL